MNKIINVFKKNKYLFIGCIFLLILLIGGTFAWWTLTLKGADNVLKAGTLALNLNESESEGISLNETIPMTDTNGLKTTPYTFSLENNGDISIDYTIYLDDMDLDENQIKMNEDYLKYSLTIDDGEPTTGFIKALNTE